MVKRVRDPRGRGRTFGLCKAVTHGLLVRGVAIRCSLRPSWCLRKTRSCNSSADTHKSTFDAPALWALCSCAVKTPGRSRPGFLVSSLQIDAPAS